MDRIALVTGGNRGIGLAVCRQLGALGYQVILTSRDVDKGEKAAVALRAAGCSVTVAPLDVDREASVAQLKTLVDRDFGRLDVLVNNAAVYLDEGMSVFDVDMATVRTTIKTNVYGPLMLCQAFVPGMRRQKYGRVVNVSSGAGQISQMESGTPAYAISKAALNALTRIVADEVEGTNVKVNAVCPGWVRTEMGGPGAPRTVEQGADTIVWLATLPDDGPTNGFFRDRHPIAW
jgi:NAD(P)-dependent dehydrogenase (short-subunit alcohol dehydrogenase family)